MYPVAFAFYEEKKWPLCPSGKSQYFLWFTKLGQVSAIISLIFLSRGSCFQNVTTAINLRPIESFGGTGWWLANFCWWLSDEIVGRKQQNRNSQYHKAWLLKYIILWATKNTFYLYLISDKQLKTYEMWIKHKVGRVEEWFPKVILFLLSCSWTTWCRPQQSQALRPSLPFCLQALFFRRWIFLHLILMLCKWEEK